MPDLTPVDYQPEFDRIAPQGSLAQQVSGFPQRAADLAINALGPLGEAGMTVGDWLRTGGSSFDTRDIAPVAAGVMLGTAAPEAEEAAPIAEAAQAAAKGIRAYHGSPYDFDKFDLSKIGTGEGAQAYGHGLYFAEAEPVAWSYRFNKAPSYLTNGADSFARQAASMAEDAGLTGDEAKKYALNVLHNKAMTLPASGRQPWFDAMNNFDTLTGNPATPGRMYEVNINADPSHFLDWDKPLSEQPAKAKALFRDLGMVGPNFTDADIDAIKGGSLGQSFTVSGRGGYNKFTPDQFAERMRQAGIPGIRYLDQGSRPSVQIQSQIDNLQRYIDEFASDKHPAVVAKRNDYIAQQNALKDQLAKQTHNYVVFDPSMIDIIKKYGIAGLIAGGAAHFKTTPVDHQPQFTQ